MPKASLVALLAAGVVTVTPLVTFAQNASQPDAARAAPPAKAAAPAKPARTAANNSAPAAAPATKAAPAKTPAAANANASAGAPATAPAAKATAPAAKTTTKAATAKPGATSAATTAASATGTGTAATNAGASASGATGAAPSAAPLGTDGPANGNAPEAAPIPPAGAAATTAPDYDDLDAAGPPAGEPAPARAGIGPMLPGAGLTAPEPAPASATPKSSQAADAEAKDDSILAEDWWSHSRPIIEIHGYFRTRAELFHNFSLGRANPPDQQLWPRPTEGYYTSVGSDTRPYGSTVCTTADASSDTRTPCGNKTQSSANLRLRLNPEIHVSDNLRIMTQIDILDNLVLGSTPSGYANAPAAGGGYSVVRRSGYNPLAFFDSTQEPPSAGINGYKDSVRVKRAWAEYSTPVGQLRFGRMPDHFGMGMVHNAGDGYDHDYQSTIDRIMFITDIRPLDLHVGGSWDFPSEGRTSENLQNPGGQAYDLAQLDDVKQWSLLLLRRKNPQLERMSLTRGDVVLNFGAYVTYRKQYLASDASGPTGVCSDQSGGGVPLGCTMDQISNSYTRRNAYAWTPDLWGQLLYKGFRFEFEAATIQGKIDNTTPAGSGSNYTTAPGGAGWRLNAWGVATQIQQKLLEDKLDLSFGFGWASGDPNVDKGSTSQSESGALGLTPGNDGLQQPRGSNSFKTFRFHPSYQMDLILHRNLLTRVQGTYYFRPSVGYDFMRKPNGQRLGGNVAGIWTRASEYIQAPGHKRDIGIELNGSVYFQSKDGVLNDRPGAMGGFFTMLQYGLLFPMDGMGYPQNVVNAPGRSTAQIVRWYMGVFF